MDWEEDPDAASGGEDIDFGALHDPEANAKICAGIGMGIKMQVQDPELAATLTPDYVRTAVLLAPFPTEKAGTAFLLRLASPHGLASAALLL